jgi:apolipoprotein N-acyltransferase
VGLLQPSVNQDEKWTKAFINETYNRYESLIQTCAKAKPDLILWPETGAPDCLRFNPSLLARVSRMAMEGGTPELVGCLDVAKKTENGLDYFNAAQEFDEKGKPGNIYHKCHLVPFGEFMPFQKYLSFLGPIVSNLGNFTAGDRYEKLSARSFTYSPTICYEAIFPGDMRKAMKTGADALVNISNDAWYGHTAAAFQHAQMGIMRSSELRRPVLRAANTGISYITDPFGRVLVSTPFFTQQAVVGDVLTVDHPMTFYSAWGNWLPEFCLWLTLVLLIMGIVLKAPSGVQPEPGPSPVPEKDLAQGGEK